MLQYAIQIILLALASFTGLTAIQQIIMDNIKIKQKQNGGKNGNKNNI